MKRYLYVLCLLFLCAASPALADLPSDVETILQDKALRRASVGVEEQRLVSKPNMQFSKSAVYSYSSKIMSQVQPGLAVSGGAQPSTCTICR